MDAALGVAGAVTASVLARREPGVIAERVLAAGTRRNGTRDVDGFHNSHHQPRRVHLIDVEQRQHRLPEAPSLLVLSGGATADALQVGSEFVEVLDRVLGLTAPQRVVLVQHPGPQQVADGVGGCLRGQGE